TLNGLAASNFGTSNAANGTLTLSWLDPDVSGITLTDGTVIYQLCFKVLGSCGDVTNLEFTNSPTTIEVTDGNGNLVNFTSNPGVVDICGTAPVANVGIVASDYMANENEEFCIDVSVNNFNNIASLAYSMNFDPAKVQFQSIQLANNLTGLDMTDFDLTNASSGNLTLNWQDAAGATLPNGTVIYQACFKNISPCGTAATEFAFTNSPTPASVTDANGNALNLNTTNGAITFCTTPPPPPSNEFVVASDHTPAEGEVFCMDISVNGFTDIVSMQYSMTFDATILEFQSVEIPGTLNGLAASNFGTSNAANGTLTLSWLDPNVSGITLADGTVIYQLCFKVIGSCDDVTNLEFTNSPTTIEVTDANGNLVNFSSNPGVVEVCGTGNPPPPPSNEFVVASDHVVNPGDMFCMDISVNGFTDIVSMQYSMSFDPTKLEFQSVQIPGTLNGLAVSNFGTSNAANGTITLSWLDPNVSGITLADGTVIYQLCFKAIGNCGDGTNLSFTDSPTTIEVTDIGGNLVNFTSNPGVVSYCGTPPPDFTLTISDETVSENGSTCVKVSVQGFTNIVSMQYSVTFDPNILQFTSTQNYNLPDLSSANFGTSGAANGVITFSWIDPNTTGVTLPDNTVIYEICFDAVGSAGQVSSVSFSDTPTVVEIGTTTGVINPVLENGSVTIADACPGPVVLVNSTIQQIDCNGDQDGIIDITVSGGDGNYSYEWRNASNVVVSTNEDFVGGAGIYTVQIQSCSGGTTLNETFTLTEPDPIQVNITPTNVTCFGENNGLIITDPSGGTLPFSYLWSNGSTNLSISNLAAGTYSFTVTDGKGCQFVSPQIEITEPPQLTINASTIEPACFGDLGTITLSANGGTPGYEYSKDGGATWQTSNIFLNVDEGVYTAMVRDSRGCVATVSSDVVINVPDPINLNMTSTFDGGSCIGSASVQVSGGSTIADYFWSGPNGNGYTNAPTQTGLCAGQHCVIVQDINGCQESACVYVSQPLAISGTVKNACWGINNGEINVNAQGGIPQGTTYTYAWSPAVPNPGSPNQTGLSPGTYCVTVTSSPDGQVKDMCFNVTQAQEPVQIGNVNLENPTGPGFFDGSIQVSGVTGGFSGPYSYQWSPNLGAGPVLNNLNEGTYNLTVTDVNGCNISASYVLVIDPTDLQFVTFDVQDAKCSDSNDGTFTFSVSGGLPTYNVTITGPGGPYNFPSLAANTVKVLQNLEPGNYSVHVEYNNAGFSDAIDTDFTIEAPDPLVLASVKVLNKTEAPGSGGSIFIDIDGGDAPYQYVWSNGNTSQNIFDLQPGPYSVTITDQAGCTMEFGVFSVKLFRVNGAQIENVDCPNDNTGSITPNIVGVTGTPSCEWTGPDGEKYFTCDLDGLSAGEYTLVVTDSCDVETIPYTFEVKANSDINVTASPTTNVNGFNVSCYGASDGDATAVVTGGQAPYAYFWSNNTFDKDLQDVPAGTYSVTVSDALGCEDEATVTLKQPDSLSAVLAAVAEPSCFGAQNGSATVNVSGGVPFPGANAYLYKWSDTQGQTGPTAILLKSGNYKCTVTDRNGCQEIVPVTIEDPEKMVVQITTTCDNGEADGTALANIFGGTPPYSIEWTTGDTSQFITDLTVGTYFVQVVDANGCQATDVDGGYVCPNFGCFEVRTVITPEGDGKNEEFIIGCTSKYPDNHLEIYNRWGQLVYEADNYVCQDGDLDECWKGTNLRGEDLPEGVYFYIFDFVDPATNREDQKRGSVTILRQ
ncbi:MAG: hypothetical protein D6714_16725, partial [Bacteroidetes bacterium]